MLWETPPPDHARGNGPKPRVLNLNRRGRALMNRPWQWAVVIEEGKSDSRLKAVAALSVLAPASKWEVTARKHGRGVRVYARFKGRKLK